VTDSRSRAWLCFIATEEGEEEDGLLEDRSEGDQVLWKGGLSLSLSLMLFSRSRFCPLFSSLAFLIVAIV
jgi:hypothetical protein